MNCSCAIAAGALLGATALAAAQLNTYNIVVSNDILEDQPSTTIQVWAAFEPQYHAFARARFEMHASADEGGFSDPTTTFEAPYSYPGDVPPDGDAVINIYVWQIEGYGGFFADTSNPILLWEATWSTTDFTPRRIVLDSLTSFFAVYINDFGVGKDLTDEFTEGHAEFFISLCYPDFDESGTLDLFDFLEFVNLFNADNPLADCTADGAFDLFDFLCFINAFNAGC